MNSISAYGKIILFGEHAVVYGCPALAVGIPQGMTVRRLSPATNLSFTIPKWDLNENDSCDNIFGDMLRRLDKIVPGDSLGCHAILDANVPSGAGLGSSSALSVVMVAALAKIRSIRLSQHELRLMAHELEKIFHGSPSGIDDTVATFGGLCLFHRKGKNKIDRGDKITEEATKVSAHIPPLVIGHSGIARSTKKMVAHVRTQWESDTKGINKLFDQIQGCVENGIKALQSQNADDLGTQLLKNQKLLKKLNVSHPVLDTMVDTAIKAGAVGAKLTGAGGGGCVIALAPGQENKIIEHWNSQGWSAWKVDFQRPDEKVKQ